ncbi:MAG: ribonuclease E/G, partial [Pseudomonadota bacterium]|nr:ribonuclease E/G [Pseudomonadota bacterium]
KENFVEDLTYFEKKNKMKIDIITDNSLIIPEYIIDIKNKSKKTLELIEYYEKLINLDQQMKNGNIIELKDKKKFKKKIFIKKKKYYKKAK